MAKSTVQGQANHAARSVPSVEQCREALAVTVNMTVAIETICAAAKHCDAVELNGLLDAILACLEKQSNVVCPALDSLNESSPDVAEVSRA